MSLYQGANPWVAGGVRYLHDRCHVWAYKVMFIAIGCCHGGSKSPYISDITQCETQAWEGMDYDGYVQQYTVKRL